MSIRYESLDAAVRGAMVRELETDRANGTLYISPRLTEVGARAWPEILQEAFEKHDAPGLPQLCARAASFALRSSGASPRAVTPRLRFRIRPRIR